MKANELQINNFLQVPNVQFVIPVYQRNYDWTHSECKELLNDIISVEKENRGTHFIGSIVYVHEGTYSTSEVKELVIIDGQQRLTTINILYVALYRFAKANHRQHDAERIYNMFLTNQYVRQETSKLKLKQTDVNSAAFQAILNGREKEYNTYSNVIENFNYLLNEVTDETYETILNGLNRLIFVEISLERDKDDPQRIFESLNSTGLDLSQSDLIRNFILMDLPPRDQIRIYDTIWNPIEENAKDRLRQKSVVSEFIRDYLTLKTKKIPNKNKVYPEFKRQYPNKKDEYFLQELENIKSLSHHYKKFVNPDQESDPIVRKELEYINRLEINVAYPFLLQVFEDKDNGIISRDELVSVLKLIQSYTWRRFIVGLPTNALNKIFMALYTEVDQEEYVASIAKALVKKRGGGKFPSNEEIKIALRDKDLYNTQAKNRSYLFELLENFNNREYVDTTSENITVEHIYPQNPSDEWSKQLSPDDYFAFKEKFLNTIGNLTLSGNNGNLGNKDFRTKKHMNQNGGEQGYIYSRLWLNSYLKSIDGWDIEAFNERYNIIYNRFINVWEYPKVELIESANEDERNIFDADDPTHKKLEYFIFEDAKIETEAVSHMYLYVIKELYEKNTQLLTSNQSVFKITRNLDDFRSPQEVQNGWYVETNVDSSSKITYLKRLLTLFELEDELIIKYSNTGDSNSSPTRFSLRRAYWEQLLPKLKEINLFTNVGPSTGYWLSTGAGVSGVYFTMIVKQNSVRVELTLGSHRKETNKRNFHKLLEDKNEIESTFGSLLEWEQLPENKMSKITTEKMGIGIALPECIDSMNDYFIETLPRFVRAFQEHINKLR